MAPHDPPLTKPDRDRLLDEYLVLSAQTGSRAALNGLVRAVPSPFRWPCLAAAG